MWWLKKSSATSNQRPWLPTLSPKFLPGFCKASNRLSCQLTRTESLSKRHVKVSQSTPRPSRSMTRRDRLDRLETRTDRGAFRRFAKATCTWWFLRSSRFSSRNCDTRRVWWKRLPSFTPAMATSSLRSSEDPTIRTSESSPRRTTIAARSSSGSATRRCRRFRASAMP